MSKSPRPDMIRRRTGRPMLCPVCEGDVWADEPHVCPEGYVMPAAAGTYLTFYGYQATTHCCGDWLLLGWPQVDGKPKLTSDAERGRMGFDCPKCAKRIWFAITEPEMMVRWDVRERGTPPPPALVMGRLTAP